MRVQLKPDDGLSTTGTEKMETGNIKFSRQEEAKCRLSFASSKTMCDF